MKFQCGFLLLLSSSLALGCAGSDGDDGTETLVSTTAEAAGANCDEGGLKLEFGSDLDGNGSLSADEVTSTEFVCNGASGDGTNGDNGLQSLLASEALSPGLDCSFGGFRVNFGIDDSGDGVLDAAEIDGNQLFCNVRCPVDLLVLTKDFTNQGTSTTATLDDGELAVTSSPADINVLNLNGLGVVGGVNNNTVDAGESLTFTFSEPAFDVSYLVSSAGNTDGNGTVGDRSIEAIGLDSVSLGAVANTGTGSLAVVVPDSNTPIASFSDSVTVDVHRVARVIYSVCRLP
jgi:hypothetical protein